MVQCKLCGKELKNIVLHLYYQHDGMTLKEYRKRFPDAETHEKYVRRKRDRSILHIFEDGRHTGDFEMDKSVVDLFREFRDRFDLTTADALLFLIRSFEECEKLRIEKKNTDLVEEIESTKSPRSLAKFHREQLQRILLLLEERAKKENDVKQQAEIAERISRILKVLPDLDVQHQEDIDRQISELVEKRKAICRNYLPEDKSMPW